MKLTERINFRQPKYMLPAIVYLPLLGASYFIFDLFDTKVAEKKDANMQTTEYLNPNLPQAHIKGGDGIGGKYENMLNAYGKIEDHSAVENIDRDNEQEKEEYQSKYSDAELQQLDAEAKRQAEMEKADFINLENAKLWNPESTKAACNFAYSMGLNIRKPLRNVAEILYSYAYHNLSNGTKETLAG